MKQPQEPTPEGIALYRKLQRESPEGWTEEEFQAWRRSLIKRKAEALGVPEHVIEAEQDAEAAEQKAFLERQLKKDEEVRAAHPGAKIIEWWGRCPDPRRRPLPRWPREEAPGEGHE
jgi:hypothetical protein